MYHWGIIAKHFFKVLLHLLIIHFEFHALPLKLATHLVDLGGVFFDLFCMRSLLPFKVFSGSLGLGGSEPMDYK